MPYKNKKTKRENSKEYYRKNKDKIREYQKKWREKNRNKYNAYARKWAKENPEKTREQSRKKYANPKTREKIRENAMKRYRKNRLLVLQYYSNNKMCCNCCEEKEIKFLAIDHIDKRYGTGTDHRQKSGTDLCNWIVKNNFPDGFQILCHNCNMARGLYGKCPHQLKK